MQQRINYKLLPRENRDWNKEWEEFKRQQELKRLQNNEKRYEIEVGFFKKLFSCFERPNVPIEMKRMSSAEPGYQKLAVSDAAKSTSDPAKPSL